MRWVWICSLWIANALNPCVTCKFYKGDYFTLKYGKCKLFPTEDARFYSLVTGKKSAEDYYYCRTARQMESMCGQEGKKYEKNKKGVCL